MAKQQFNKLIWLVDTIFRNAPVTFAEINRRWRAGDDNRSDIPLRTFHNHRQAIEEMFDINIECDKRNNTYYIADAEGMLGDKLKMWLLNSFSLNNVLQENVDMKNRIVFEKHAPERIRHRGDHCHINEQRRRTRGKGFQMTAHRPSAGNHNNATKYKLIPAQHDRVFFLRKPLHADGGKRIGNG